jgi:hypothetical protein
MGAPPPPLRREAQAHLEEARGDYTLHAHLRDQGHFAWALTLLYYAAWHLMDAWMIQNGEEHCRNHESLKKLIERRVSSVRWQYKDLEDASRDARYELKRFTADDVQRYHDGPFGHIQAQLRRRGIAL